MINTALIDQAFIQSYDSCVLASYAVVAHYFRQNVKVREFFEEYCNIFNIQNMSIYDAEFQSSQHLNNYCGERGWRGYNMIDSLHYQTNNHLYTLNRNFFSAEIITINHLRYEEGLVISSILREQEALINFTIACNGGFHSKTCGMNLDRLLFELDTSPINPQRIKYFEKYSYEHIFECILYVRN